MKSILIVGMGRFGRHLTMNFAQTDCDILVVDSREDRVQAVLPYAAEARIGDATEEDFLESLGVSNFDICFVAIGSDFQGSLETTSLLKELGAPLVVSRASRDVQAKFLLRNGADDVIYPEKEMAAWAATRYSSANIFDYISLDEEHGIYEVAVPEDWVNRTIGEIQVRNQYNINILAIRDEEGLDLKISHNTPLNRGMHLMVLGQHEDVRKAFHLEH